MLAQAPHNDAFERLIDAAEALSDQDLRSLSAMGESDDLSGTRVAQPLLYLCDWAWGIALLESGVEPVAVAGHSLGEFAALAVAGAFSVEAGLELVVERSRLMASAAAATPGAMSAVLGLEARAIAETIDGIDGVWVANDNAPGQVVISGTSDGVAAASEALREAGARRIVELAVAGAFHSPLMEPARVAFAEILREAQINDTWLPVVQNTEPIATSDSETIRRRLIDQITSPVRWTETMYELRDKGATTLVEAGPGAVLAGLAKRVDGLVGVSADSIGIDAVVQEVS
jgi:[acyl-carrier-protein] S-malonyltransferase